ncbi:unnamed protein product [Mytilus edulis]|uniref:Uncharacterized protein n=1 Tax=Mytilus edulis TaxID=6550 RepID=A0A8S3VGE9_MYTED|nr:unnamed protein product [Mytilus edulis]
MTTELETNIVAVESEGIHRNSYRGKIVLIFIYIPTQGVVSENDNCREKEYTETPSRGVVSENDSEETNIVAVSEGIHRNSYRGVVSENDNRVRDKHCSCRESEGIQKPEVNSSYFIYIPTQGVVSENDNRLETNIVAVERVKEYTETPTEVNSSYFYIYPTQGVVSENDNRVRDKHCSCRRVKEYTETPTEVNSSYFIYISLLKE